MCYLATKWAIFGYGEICVYEWLYIASYQSAIYIYAIYAIYILYILYI